LSRNAVPPYGQVASGERLFIKYAGGPFAATALAAAVDTYDNLTPKQVAQLRARYNHAVRGEGDYWQKKRQSRFATFIHLRDVEPLDIGPPYPKTAYRGWFVLDESKSPLWELTLTGGAIRNRYLRLPEATPALRRGTLTFELPDGETVTSSLRSGNMVRWRGWGRYYAQYNLSPGDRVRLLRLAPQRFRVSFHPQGP
jgi:hypothetical protein